MKCAKYWPTDEEPNIQFGEISISLVSLCVKLSQSFGMLTGGAAPSIMSALAATIFLEVSSIFCMLHPQYHKKLSNQL